MLYLRNHLKTRTTGNNSFRVCSEYGPHDSKTLPYPFTLLFFSYSSLSHNIWSKVVLRMHTRYTINSTTSNHNSDQSSCCWLQHPKHPPAASNHSDTYFYCRITYQICGKTWLFKSSNHKFAIRTQSKTHYTRNPACVAKFLMQPKQS